MIKPKILFILLFATLLMIAMIGCTGSKPSSTDSMETMINENKSTANSEGSGTVTEGSQTGELNQGETPPKVSGSKGK